MRAVVAGVRIVIAAGLLAYIAKSGAIDWGILRGLMSAWPIMLAALALYAADLAITATRLCLLMRHTRLHLPVAASVRLALIGLFFGTFLPGAAGGDLARIYYASAGNRGRWTEVATLILFDRFIGMFAMVCWPLLMAPFFPSMLKSMPVLGALLWAAAAVAAGMILGLLAGGSATLSRVLGRLPLGDAIGRVFATLRACRTTPRVLAGAVGISLLAHTVAIGVVLLIAAALDPAGFDWRMGLLVPFGFLANQLPVTPGGLGVGEAAFSRLFSMAGFRGGAEVMLAWRLVMLGVAMLGLVAYLQGRRHDFAVPATAEMQGVETT